MAKFKGTVVGGVADGHVLEKDEPHMRVDMKKVLSVGVEPIVQSTDYRFLLLLGTSNAEIGVWAPQGIPVEKIVERLCKFYNPRTGLIGTPAPNPLRVEVENKKNG